MVPVGADCGDKASKSSRKGLVEVGRSGRPPEAMEFDGERARFLKGLFEPRFMGICGDG
jgi:hypothetical protein